MPYNPEIHHRRSIRLKNYDYSQAGAYFVTICVHKGWLNREGMTGAGQDLWLGEISDGQITLNACGEIVQLHWDKLPDHHPHVELDAFVIMPNHVHGIIVLEGVSEDSEQKRPALGDIMSNFKKFSARQINKLRKVSGIPVWQRNYYEHIIRNEEDLNRIREYIINNPLKWQEDEYYAAGESDSM